MFIGVKANLATPPTHSSPPTTPEPLRPARPAWAWTWQCWVWRITPSWTTGLLVCGAASWPRGPSSPPRATPGGPPCPRTWSGGGLPTCQMWSSWMSIRLFSEKWRKHKHKHKHWYLWWILNWHGTVFVIQSVRVIKLYINTSLVKTQPRA